MKILFILSSIVLTSIGSFAQSSPFEIKLILEKDVLKSYIKNVSGKPQYYLDNSTAQPSHLIIINKEGKIIKEEYPVCHKSDHTSYLSDYRILLPNEEILCRDSKLVFSPKKNIYSIMWDYSIKHDMISKNIYTIQLKWESKEDFFIERETKKRGKIKLWKGEILSNIIEAAF